MQERGKGFSFANHPLNACERWREDKKREREREWNRILHLSLSLLLFIRSDLMIQWQIWSSPLHLCEYKQLNVRQTRKKGKKDHWRCLPPPKNERGSAYALFDCEIWIHSTSRKTRRRFLVLSILLSKAIGPGCLSISPYVCLGHRECGPAPVLRRERHIIGSWAWVHCVSLLDSNFKCKKGQEWQRAKWKMHTVKMDEEKAFPVFHWPRVWWSQLKAENLQPQSVSQ